MHPHTSETVKSKMWSQLFLCALVGFAAASDYGWKSNTEYMYKVHGRTLTGLHEVADQYAGVVMKANLIIRPEDNGKLMAKISDAKYAQVHTQLPEGWRSEIPESKLNYQQLPLSGKPFEIVMKNGVFRDLIVSKEVQNWESNILKSIISQIQLDTQGENVIKSHVNQLPEEESNSAVFKTMEDTVTGKYETLYDISPLAEYVLQSQPWLVPMPQMKGDGEYIEIVKSKNFSRGEERVGYSFGLGNNGEWDPASNQMGDFFLRSSVSRAIISGNLKRYTVQSSSTTNKIILSPTLNSEQKGMVVSHLNLTLSHVQPASSQFQQVQQPQRLGNLVYTYNSAFSGNNAARSGSQRRSNEEYEYSSEEREQQQHHYRHRRSAVSDEQEFDSPESQDSWTQEQPKLNQPSETPLLPMFIGHQGKSIKNAQSIQIVQAVQKIAQQIGHDLQRPEQIPKEQTLAKFTILLRLARLMSEKEMQEASQQLYNKETQGPKADAWKVYRDAVAQCGSGPALLTIKSWIQNKEIQSEEAAEVIATMAQAVREPTPEYMRTFYALATKEEVRSQPILNDTAILSYTTLVRKVYIDREYSSNQYPAQSFGSFHKSNGGKQIVAQEVIPYLKQKLNHAVEQGDSHKVLVYIRALGNVADQKILAVFEPYLEGDKQISQFQRLQIVLALDKLAQVHPKVARSVLYKIYQNAGEMQEIRAAAVYQLMKTTPPASMLQRMAQYTNVDVNEQVNAAVKTAIESAAQLEGEQCAELAQNARSAQPLLTKDNYGVQYSQNQLRSYVVEQMNLMYKQNLQTLGSQDSWLPKGIKYYLRSELGGVKNELINVEAMVSSIEELTNVLEQQTEIHQQRQQQQKQNHQNAQQNQWSSEAIAKMLNIQSEEREQLEGTLLYQLGGASRFFSFNNRSIELLPRVMREIEDALRGGKNMHYSKVMNTRDMDISFPTEMGFPFVYTLDAPTLIHIQGKLSATAEPKISSGDKIHKPHTINAQSQIHAVYSSKVQAKLGFVTPFDHQQYVSGYDKNVQVNIPIKSQIEVDIKNKQMHVQIAAIEPEKNAQILHYSTVPYTAKKDILNLEPVLKSSHAQPIYADNEEQNTEMQYVFGRNNGMAFRAKYSSEQKFLDARWVYEQLSRHDAISALLAPQNDETIQYSKLSLEYAADQSSARKVQIRMGYEKRHESDESQNDNSANAEISQFSKLPHESKARQQQFAKMASAGIQNAEVTVCDFAVQFDGQNKVEYTATAALASNQADEKARFLLFAKKNSANPQESKPYQLAMSAKARVPLITGLDFAYALKFDPTTTAQMELAFGEDYQSSSKLNLNAKLYKSESRKQHLQSEHLAKECRREMQQGNQQLSACANMTAEASLMDRVNINVQYENVSPQIRNMTRKLYNAIRYMGYYNLDENTQTVYGNQNENELQFQARFEPDFEAVNVTIRAHKLEANFDQIRVNNWAKQVVAFHPVFPVSSRVLGEALALDAYRPFCTVDNSAANTFDNKTYPVELGNSWHVMLQYAPAFARQHESRQQYQKQQQDAQSEQYAVLVRDAKSQDQAKEVKMTIRNPESQGQLIEIDMKPQQKQGEFSGSNPAAKVYVNQKQYQYNDKKTTEIEGGLIKIHALSNGEVKVEVRDCYSVIYDGERVKLTAYNGKFRGAVRGLCGTFTGEEATDFLTPKNCILRKPEEFAATWAIEAEGRVQELQSRAQKSPCAYEDVVYANVVSDYDAGRNHQQYKRGHQQKHYNSGSDSCTKHQTRYVVEESDNTICFTIRPVPVCKSSCNASGHFKKSVAVHCVQKSNVAELWKQQIQKGASPDFSQKSPSKTIKIEVPESCSRY